MTNDPTPDPGGQPQRTFVQASGRLYTAVRFKADRLFDLEIRDLTAAQVARLLREARRITGARPSLDSAWFVSTAQAHGELRRGGRERSITARPDFFDLVLRHMHDHQQEFDTPLDFVTAVRQAGGTRSRAYDSLRNRGLKPEDLRFAASFGTYEDGLKYLRSIQQERRQQRI
ncbi:MAG TPA: hypothetical protein VGW38_19505 [Chloroflexota bacterium]|nr:hypothetical protein [Chloroflexota bacterium]